MRYSFLIGARDAVLSTEDQEVPDDASARIEALQFAARVLSDPPRRKAPAENLTVEVRGPDGSLRTVIHILARGERPVSLAEEELAEEGEGHPS